MTTPQQCYFQSRHPRWLSPVDTLPDCGHSICDVCWYDAGESCPACQPHGYATQAPEWFRYVASRLAHGFQPYEIADEFEATLAEITGWRMVRASWWIEDVVCLECGSTSLTGYAGICPLGHDGPLVSGREYRERRDAERKKGRQAK